MPCILFVLVLDRISALSIEETVSLDSMEIIFNAAAGFVVEVGKFMCKCIYPKIENTVCFASNVQSVREEMEKLTKFRDDIKGKVEGAEGEGYKPKPEVLKWVEHVQKLENDWESMKEDIAAAKMVAYKCCPNCSLRSRVSTQARIMRDQLRKLKKMGQNFGSGLLVENYQVKKVEFIPGPSMEGQSAATRNLNKILQLLEDDKVCIIGVWGMGGVGKTTLVKNLNNELLKIAASSSKLSFSVVIWVTVPKPPIDIRNVQEQIANRLNLKVDSEDSVERIASRIHQRLKEEESFLLILDDIWEAINLDHVGVPKREDAARSKIILTSRSSEVCRLMKTDTKMKVLTFDEDESWQMFVKNAGDIANLEHIQPVAKEIAKECDGLPLAITVIGASMRGKERLELWKDALKSLRDAEPHNKHVKDKVYKVIKWSFDSLESQDIDIELSSEQRSKYGNKRGGDIQSCFLYCSLYPVAISPDDVIRCWWAEGFLGEHDTYEEAYNRGITMIESLKDVCLLETGESNSMKMHDVVRDVAIWIANFLGDEHNSIIQAGVGLTDISKLFQEMSTSVKRISFISNGIKRLPYSFKNCPKTTTLLLQDNHRLVEIPDTFFLAFPALRVLNLSRTGIRALPSSINSLYQLRALILQNCFGLKELPPIGNLCNLQLLDCDNTRLHRLPQGMDKLTDLRRLTANHLVSIDQGILLKLASIEMINVLEGTCLESICFDELSSLQKLTSLSIKLDSSSVSNRDHTWMSRLKRFQIVVGEPLIQGYSHYLPRKLAEITISECEIFSKGELSGMLQFASNLCLDNCKGLRKFIAYNSFNGIKELTVRGCSCDFKPAEEGSGRFDPLPNLEHLRLTYINYLESVSDISHLLGLRFSKLRKLDILWCVSLRCLFNAGGAFSVPNHLEHIEIDRCGQLVELFVQCGSSQTTLANSEFPRVRKLVLKICRKLGTLGEPPNTWEHLEELSLIRCNQITKLPLSIQTSNNIKVIQGRSEWWNKLEWDSDNFKSNLEHCFQPV